MGVYKMKMAIDFDAMQKKGYEVESKIKFFDAYFSKYGIDKDSEGYYVGSSFESFWGLISFLADEDWFMDNVSEWKWYNGDYRHYNNGRFPEENILLYYQNKRKEG